MNHREEAEYLLKGRTSYYNGGQTVRHEPPTEREATAALAHALLAVLETMVDGEVAP